MVAVDWPPIWPPFYRLGKRIFLQNKWAEPQKILLNEKPGSTTGVMNVKFTGVKYLKYSISYPQSSSTFDDCVFKLGSNAGKRTISGQFFWSFQNLILLGIFFLGRIGCPRRVGRIASFRKMTPLFQMASSSSHELTKFACQKGRIEYRTLGFLASWLRHFCNHRRSWEMVFSWPSNFDFFRNRKSSSITTMVVY